MARLGATLAKLLGAAMLAGCSGNGSLLNNSETEALPPTFATAADAIRPLGSDGIGLYLETLRALVEGGSAVQAEVFRNAEAAAEAAPTTTNRLNYALALAMPGHASSNPLEAQRMLGDLLAASDALLQEERILAVVHLKEVEQRLILDAEATRLQRAASAAAAERDDESSERLRVALEDNAQLQLELNEARAKLEAITNIERSIRERENGANPQ